MNDSLAKYRTNAETHGKYTLEGNSTKTNLAYDGLHNALDELISNKADKLLFSLYENSDLSVQLWAATHTLELDERRAMDKLQAIADLGASVISMSARYTIKGWMEGELRVRSSQSK